jgi:phosphatidylserine/phosphatidylglycerophosphate/cardiolipin synthase-like enzyme
MTVFRRALALCLALAFVALPQAAVVADDGAPTLVAFRDVTAAIAVGRTITASAYTLSTRSAIAKSLQAASARGARVGVVLTGDGMGYAVAGNKAFVAQNPQIHVVLTRTPLHLKAIVVDHGAGGVFVSDRNWTPKHSLVLRLPARYALAVERAALGDPHDDGAFTATKITSLRREAELIGAARRTIVVESESFSDENPVYDALVAARARGVAITLLVSDREYGETPRERGIIAALVRSGIRCGLSRNAQKILVVDDLAAGWVGSSNATRGVPRQVDFGFATTDPRLIRVLRSELARDAQGLAFHAIHDQRADVVARSVMLEASEAR